MKREQPTTEEQGRLNWSCVAVMLGVMLAMILFGLIGVDTFMAIALSVGGIGLILTGFVFYLRKLEYMTYLGFAYVGLGLMLGALLGFAFFSTVDSLT
jgi:hypothetical protein